MPKHSATLEAKPSINVLRPTATLAPYSVVKYAGTAYDPHKDSNVAAYTVVEDCHNLSTARSIFQPLKANETVADFGYHILDNHSGYFLSDHTVHPQFGN